MLHLVLLSILAIATQSLAVTPVTGGKYTISPKSFPNLCLAPEYDHEGALVVTKDCDTNSDIVWSWSGSQWTNTATNKGFDVRDGGRWNGNKVQIWTQYAWNQNQQFILPNEQIQWASSNLVMDLTDGRGQVGTNIQLWQGYGHNSNQMWEFVDAEEIEECEDGSAPAASSISASPLAATTSPSAASSPSATSAASAASAAASPSGLENNQLYAGGNGQASASASASSSRKSNNKSKSSASSAAASKTTSAGSAASSPSASSGSSSSSSGTYSSGFSGTILKTSGTKIVDGSGKQVVLRGTNLGGWLVFEDWMCGITDYSGNADRFPQWTLESRFGEAKTKELMNVWMDNWLTADSFDKIKSLGMNLVRLPFSYRNFQNMDGSWSDDGFTRLDWAFNQAKRVGIYVIPVFHIWDTQKERYSMISEDNSDGKASRQRAGDMWKKIAARYANEPIIAAWDLINEPTGSANDNLQRDLYDAVRSVDQNHILIQASIGTNPANYGWKNVVYTQHEYLMMGSDYNGNVGAYWNGPGASISQFQGMNIPAYIGEFMADGQTLNYMLGQLNQANVWWSHWTTHTVQMDRWGLWNYGSNMRVDVSNDSYDTIKSKWSNMGSLTRQGVADQYQTYTGGKTRRDLEGEQEVERDLEVEQVEKRAIESPRVEQTLKRSNHPGGHGGRSRRSLVHGVRNGVLKTSF